MSGPLLICGLGNPGSQYRNTRHNIGFMVLDRLAADTGIRFDRSMFESKWAEVFLAGTKVVMLQPQTFMNLSGRSLAQFVRYFKVPFDQVLVICDDINLPFGQFRLRKGGGAGGHNGLKSIAGSIGSQDFPRLRIGIEGGDLQSTAGHVLSPFSADEEKILTTRLVEAVDCVREWATVGMESAMNKFNRRVDTPEGV